MSKPDQTPARAEACSSKAQAGAEKGKGQKGPPSISVSGPSTVTKPPQQYAERRMVRKVLSNLKVLIKLLRMMRVMNREVLPKGRTMMAKKKNL